METRFKVKKKIVSDRSVKVKLPVDKNGKVSTGTGSNTIICTEAK
jgi:hypothetical protein